MKARLVEKDVMVIMILLQKLRSFSSRLSADAGEMIDSAIFRRQLHSGGGGHRSVMIDSRHSGGNDEWCSRNRLILPSSRAQQTEGAGKHGLLYTGWKWTENLGIIHAAAKDDTALLYVHHVRCTRIFPMRRKVDKVMLTKMRNLTSPHRTTSSSSPSPSDFGP